MSLPSGKDASVKVENTSQMPSNSFGKNTSDGLPFNTFISLFGVCSTVVTASASSFMMLFNSRPQMPLN